MSTQLHNARSRLVAWCIVCVLLMGLGGCIRQPQGSSRAPGFQNNSHALDIAPNSPYIRYMGRAEVTPGYALYDWAGLQIEFKAHAESVGLVIEDGNNDYNVFVNGALHSVVSTTPGANTYPLVLGSGEHHLRITKRTGPNFGVGRFLGVRLAEGGRMLDLPVAVARKIEFIGDSYTVGYGNEGPGLDCAGVYRPYENSYDSYASIAARALQAQSHLVAISGYGAVRNYAEATTTSATPVPFYYGRTLMARDDLPWDFQSWVPDAVVIKLGTNDHSTQPEPSARVFVQAVHDLIAQVHDGYGRLPIFLLADTSLTQLVARTQTVVAQQQGMGNKQIHFVQLTHPPKSQLGCDWHPSTAGHQAMAAELVAAIKPILGW